MKLKELRKSKGLTQKEFAQIINVASTTYLGYEKELYEPNLETLKQIADYYGVSLDYLCEHKMKAFDFGYLNEQQINLINKIKALGSDDIIQVNGYVDAILANKNKRKNF